MQKRFCTCGHVVFVRYLSTNGSWKPLFMVGKRLSERQKNPASTCPKCGSPLNINTLR